MQDSVLVQLDAALFDLASRRNDVLGGDETLCYIIAVADAPTTFYVEVIFVHFVFAILLLRHGDDLPYRASILTDKIRGGFALPLVEVFDPLLCRPSSNPHGCFMLDAERVLIPTVHPQSVLSELSCFLYMFSFQLFNPFKLMQCQIKLHSTWSFDCLCQNTSKAVQQRTDRSLRRTDVCLSGTQIK